MQINISGEQHNSASCVEFDIDENQAYISDGLGMAVMIESEEQCGDIISALQKIVNAGYFVQQ